jgi:hypothetical protein
MYGGIVMMFQGVSHWCHQVETGHMNVTYSPWLGRPSVSNMDMNAQHIDMTIHANRQVKLQELSTELGISYIVTIDITHGVLQYWKVSVW